MSIKQFFWFHMFFTLVWGLAREAAGLLEWPLGFVAGLLLLLILKPVIGSGEYLRRLWLILRCIVEFIRDLIASNLQVAWDVITPTDHYEPHMVRVPIDDLNNVEMTILSSMITLTPGTLSVDLDETRKWLLVHVMYPTDLETLPKRLRRPIDLIRGEVPAS